jgi:hypothetical protein
MWIGRERYKRAIRARRDSGCSIRPIQFSNSKQEPSFSRCGCIRVLLHALRKAPPSKEGRRSAGRRILVMPHHSGCGGGFSGSRPPLGAPPRSRPGGERQSSIRAALHANPDRGLPLKRGTSHAGRNAGGVVARTARERGYEPRPQAPYPPRQLAVTGDVPSWAGRLYVTETETDVNGNVTTYSVTLRWPRSGPRRATARVSSPHPSRLAIARRERA